MSRDRGLRLQNALARYLSAWWPSAESAGAGRPGSDVLGTPGIVWENKTAREFRPAEWVRQARHHATDCGCWHRPCAPGCDEQTGFPAVPVVVYWPDRVGDQSPEASMAILPLPELVALLLRPEGCPEFDVPMRETS
jgi:hypothetical protein